MTPLSEVLNSSPHRAHAFPSPTFPSWGPPRFQLPFEPPFFLLPLILRLDHLPPYLRPFFSPVLFFPVDNEPFFPDFCSRVLFKSSSSSTFSAF